MPGLTSSIMPAADIDLGTLSKRARHFPYMYQPRRFFFVAATGRLKYQREGGSDPPRLLPLCAVRRHADDDSTLVFECSHPVPDVICRTETPADAARVLELLSGLYTDAAKAREASSKRDHRSEVHVVSQQRRAEHAPS